MMKKLVRTHDDVDIYVCSEDNVTLKRNNETFYWELLDSDGNVIDFGQYRHDLGEKHGYEITYLC